MFILLTLQENQHFHALFRSELFSAPAFELHSPTWVRGERTASWCRFRPGSPPRKLRACFRGCTGSSCSCKCSWRGAASWRQRSTGAAGSRRKWASQSSVFKYKYHKHCISDFFINSNVNSILRKFYLVISKQRGAAVFWTIKKRLCSLLWQIQEKTSSIS